jgi:hypothetical protein
VAAALTPRRDRRGRPDAVAASRGLQRHGVPAADRHDPRGREPPERRDRAGRLSLRGDRATIRQLHRSSTPAPTFVVAARRGPPPRAGLRRRSRPGAVGRCERTRCSR